VSQEINAYVSEFRRSVIFSFGDVSNLEKKLFDTILQDGQDPTALSSDERIRPALQGLRRALLLREAAAAAVRFASNQATAASTGFPLAEKCLWQTFPDSQLFLQKLQQANAADVSAVEQLFVAAAIPTDTLRNVRALAAASTEQILLFAHAEHVERKTRNADSKLVPIHDAIPEKTVTAMTALHPKVFVSHSSVDSLLAGKIADLLVRALALRPQDVRCTSVAAYRLPGGAHTSTQLRDEIAQAEVFIALLTEASVKSSYVLFELGARWSTGRWLAPLLGPSADFSILKAPLNELNAMRTTNRSELHQLVSHIADVLGLEQHSPQYFSDAVDEIVNMR